MGGEECGWVAAIPARSGRPVLVCLVCPALSCSVLLWPGFLYAVLHLRPCVGVHVSCTPYVYVYVSLSVSARSYGHALCRLRSNIKRVIIHAARFDGEITRKGRVIGVILSLIHI